MKAIVEVRNLTAEGCRGRQIGNRVHPRRQERRRVADSNCCRAVALARWWRRIQKSYRNQVVAPDARGQKRQERVATRRKSAPGNVGGWDHRASGAVGTYLYVIFMRELFCDTSTVPVALLPCETFVKAEPESELDSSGCGLCNYNIQAKTVLAKSSMCTAVREDRPWYYFVRTPFSS